jgi:hypothetical protein
VHNISTPTTSQSGLALPPVIYVDAGTVTTPPGRSASRPPGELHLRDLSAISWGSTSSGVTTNYNCQRGSAYVSGPVDGQVNIAAKDDIVVTGDLTAQDSTTDIIGLTAGNCVGLPPDPLQRQRVVQHPAGEHDPAAITSLRHSFIVRTGTRATRWPR